MNRLIYPNSVYPLIGDVESTAGNQGVVVTGLQQVPLDSTTISHPVDGDVVQYDGTLGEYIAASVGPSGVTSVTASYPLASSGGLTPNITLAPLVSFVINDGSTGTNIGPMLAARQAGQVIKCVIVTKASDGSTDLTFKIKKNSTDVFSADPTIAHGTSSGTVTTSTSLTSVPLSVAANDVFSIDITSGSTSWKFTAQLE